MKNKLIFQTLQSAICTVNLFKAASIMFWSSAELWKGTWLKSLHLSWLTVKCRWELFGSSQVSASDSGLLKTLLFLKDWPVTEVYTGIQPVMRGIAWDVFLCIGTQLRNGRASPLSSLRAESYTIPISQIGEMEQKMLAIRCSETPAKNALLQVTWWVGVMQPKNDPCYSLYF